MTTHYDNRTEKFVNYEKKTCESPNVKISVMHYTQNGVEYILSFRGIEDDGKFYEYVSYNTFKNEPSIIPEGYVKCETDLDYVNDYRCGNKKILSEVTPVIPESRHTSHELYWTHDNGGRAFAVYYNKNSDSQEDKNVYIYEFPKDVAWPWDEEVESENYYVDLVATYSPINVWIPKGHLINTQNVEDNHLRFEGNSILLQLTERKCVFIGTEIYEFDLDENENVHSYYSLVGNSDVPYPVLVGSKNVYFMLDYKFVPIEKFNNFTELQFMDGYSYYYGHSIVSEETSYSSGEELCDNTNVSTLIDDDSDESNSNKKWTAHEKNRKDRAFSNFAQNMKNHVLVFGRHF